MVLVQLLLLKSLTFRSTNVHQVWPADDATGAGTLTDLKKWWDQVTQVGRLYGYHVKPSKSWLIIKDCSKIEEAEELFKSSPIKITASGNSL